VNATELEVDREKSEGVAEHQEVPKEDTAVEIIGALDDRYGARHLAVGCRRKPKKRTQRDGGSRNKVAAVLILHRARDTFVRDQARMMYKEPRKDGLSGKDDRRDRNATTA
jgi:hypothetical protein